MQIYLCTLKELGDKDLEEWLWEGNNLQFVYDGGTNSSNDEGSRMSMIEAAPYNRVQ